MRVNPAAIRAATMRKRALLVAACDVGSLATQVAAVSAGLQPLVLQRFLMLRRAVARRDLERYAGYAACCVQHV